MKKIIESVIIESSTISFIHLTWFSIGLPSAGIYTLNIPVAVGGTEYIKSELQGAANAPPDDLDFTMAFMLVGEGTAFGVLQDLLIPS